MGKMIGYCGFCGYWITAETTAKDLKYCIICKKEAEEFALERGFTLLQENEVEVADL